MAAVMKPVSRGPILETMRTIKRVAAWLAVAAIGGALVFAPAASADSSANPGPHVAPAPAAGPPPNGSDEDPTVPSGTNPNSEVPYDPYIKNPGGGVDLAS
jgi:hypothetical protein